MQVLAMDMGASGAMLVMRDAPTPMAPPELVSLPHCWDWRTTARLERHLPEIREAFGVMADAFAPNAVAIERAVSIRGRRHVGVAQGVWTGRVREWADQRGLPVVVVRGQGPRQAEQAARLYPELREAGEHAADVASIACAALWEMRREKSRAACQR